MIDLLFPVSIKKNCKLVIYGADITGHVFAEQISSLRHCEIVCFIDKKIKESYLGIPVYQPEWIKNNLSNFDFILLGTTNQNAISQIRELLIEEWGIDLSKVVSDGYQLIFKGGGIADLYNCNEIISMVKRFGNSEYSVEKSVKYLIEYLKTGCEGENISQLKKAYLDESNIKAKIIFAYMLYRSGNWDSEFMRDFHSFLYKLADSHLIWAHRLIFDVGNFPVLRYPQYRYYEYYIDRKKIITKISKKLIETKSINKASHMSVNDRIAFCCIQLYGEDYHLTKIIARYANEMCRRGKNVKIFVENKCYAPNEFFIENTYGSGIDAREFEASNRSIFSEGIEVCYASGASIREKTQNFVEKIKEYNPEVIFYYNSESSCITQSLVSMFPIVNITTVRMGSNASYHMLAVTNKQMFLEIDKKNKFIDNVEKIAEYPRCMIKPVTRSEYSRKDFNLNETDFVIITVGNRLQYEVKKDLVDELCKHLKANQFVWLIVGCKEIKYISDYYGELIREQKIRFIPYEKDLCALYKICDVYLNPRRQGGGTSITWAMYEKLPVLTISEISDGFDWIGDELAVHGNYKDMMKELYRLYSDEEYRNLMKQRFREKINDNFNEEYSTQCLMEIAKKAVSSFQ